MSKTRDALSAVHQALLQKLSQRLLPARSPTAAPRRQDGEKVARTAQRKPINATAEIPESVACSLNRLLQFRTKATKYNFIKERMKAASINLGGHKSPFRGRGMEFEEVRLYQSSDDIRHIDWRVTARTGQPHTKLFREERERPIFIVVDQSRSMFFGSVCQFKSVLAAHLAAALAWYGFHARDRVGGIIFNDDQLIEQKPVSGKHGTLRYLHHLSSMNQLLAKPLSEPVGLIEQSVAADGQNSLLQSLQHLHATAKPGSLIYLISDFHNLHSEENATLQQIQTQLALLRRHNDIHGLITYDPLEKQLPDMGLIGLSNGTERTQVDTHPASLRQQHADHFAAAAQRLTSTLVDLGIPAHFFSTETSVEQQLSGGHLS